MNEEKFSKKQIIATSILTIFIVATIFAVILTSGNDAEIEIPVIDHRELGELGEERGGLTVVDLRPFDEYNKTTIGGSVNLPWGCHGCFIDDAHSRLEENETIVVFGPFTENASRVLYNEGWTDIWILEDPEAVALIEPYWKT